MEGSTIYLTDCTITYWVDPEGYIVSTNEEWDRFALENDAEQMTKGAVHGKFLYDFFQHAEVRFIYQRLFARVVELNRPITVPFRCDSPTEKRQFDLTIHQPVKGATKVTATLVWSEKCDNSKVLDPTSERDDRLLVVCSWCKRFRVEGVGWVEAEAAVHHLNLMATSTVPRFTHSICEDCDRSISELI